MKQSAWDLSLFMFYPPLGLATNIMVCFCVFYNITLQIAFTYLVSWFIAFSNEDLDSLAVDFISWREHVSPDVHSSVCDMSFVLGSEFKQLQTYITFKEYTGYGGFWSPGLMLCLTVCATWSLSVLKVVGEVIDQVKAIWYITDRDCSIMEIAVVDGGFMLETIPSFRFITFVLMCTTQFTIACTLLLAGLVWLGSTTDIVELLLNGVALAYIMDIDELTYRVLVPTKLDTLICRLEPIYVEWNMDLPVRSMLMCAPIFGIIVIAMTTILQPHADSVFMVQNILCA